MTNEIEKEEKLIIAKVRSFKNGQRVVTIPREDKTLVDNDYVKVIKINKGDII